MTGKQAYDELAYGTAVRVKYWTPCNRIWMQWHDDMGEHIMMGDGTTLFRDDINYGGALWILDALMSKDDIWEAYKEPEAVAS
jgi:hypothetical protein